MPRGRSYRRHKQALRKMQVELAFHNTAKRRRTMIEERHKRQLMLRDPDLLERLEAEAQHDYYVQMDQLDRKIETYYTQRRREVRAYNDWKARHQRREALAEAEDKRRED